MHLPHDSTPIPTRKTPYGALGHAEEGGLCVALDGEC